VNATAKQQLRRNVANDPYSNPTKTYSVPATENPDGTLNIPAQAVYPIDPNVEPIQTTMPVRAYGLDAGSSGAIAGPSYTRSVNAAISSNSFSPAGADNGPVVLAISELYNNVSNGWEAERTPMIYRHALCTSVAATAVWDPAAGKKFRIMGYVIVPAAGMAAAGIQLITLLDQAAAIVIAHQVYLPIAASITNQPPIVVQLPGNGYLSVAADNILNCTLTAACTAGAISIFVYGTEE